MLLSLASSEFGKDIIGVVTREDKPKNRGHVMTPPPVKVTAGKYGYTVYQPKTLKDEAFASLFRELAPDVCVVAAYGRILPHYVLSDPKYGGLCVHGSLLPKYRGAAPFQRALMSGEKAVGITIMQMDDGIDTGDMLTKRWILPRGKKNCGQIETELAVKGAEALLSVMRSLGTDKYPPRRQTDKNASYAKKIENEDRALDFSKSAEECENKLLALSPSPLATAMLDGAQVKITLAEVLCECPDGEPGTVSALSNKGNGYISVNCGNNKLRILRLVPEGKGEMSAGDAVRGRKVSKESKFS